MSWRLNYSKTEHETDVTLECEDNVPGNEVQPWLDKWAEVVYMLGCEPTTNFVELEADYEEVRDGAGNIVGRIPGRTEQLGPSWIRHRDSNKNHQVWEECEICDGKAEEGGS